MLKNNIRFTPEERYEWCKECLRKKGYIKHIFDEYGEVKAEKIVHYNKKQLSKFNAYISAYEMVFYGKNLKYGESLEETYYRYLDIIKRNGYEYRDTFCKPTPKMRWLVELYDVKYNGKIFMEYSKKESDYLFDTDIVYDIMNDNEFRPSKNAPMKLNVFNKGLR